MQYGRNIRGWLTRRDWVWEIFDLGIPDGVLSSDDRRRIRVITIATLALLGVGLASIVQYWLLGLPTMVAAIGTTMILALGNLLLLRATRRPVLCGNLALLTLTTLLTFSNVVSGGFDDPNFGWFYLVPLGAAILVGVRGAGVWTGVTVALTVGFWVAPQLGLEFVNHIPEELRNSQALFNRLSAIVGIGLLGASFVTSQRESEHDLARTNEELFRETAYVQLLQHAAISANEATSFDAAMRDAVERICATMDWPAGQIFYVAEGKLVRARFAHVEQGAERIHQAKDPSRRSMSLPTRALATRLPQLVGDFADVVKFPEAGLARAVGLRSAFAVPVLSHGEVRAVLEFGCTSAVSQDSRLLEVLRLIGIQLGRVDERAVLQERVRRSQKMEAVGQLAAGLAHEINNPMSYVRSNLHVLREEWEVLRKRVSRTDEPASFDTAFDECKELIDDALEGVDRTVAIVRDVKEFSHSGQDGSSGWSQAELGELLDGALRVASARAGGGIRFERCYEEMPVIDCAPNQLQQVFVNLIVNSLQAIDESGEIRLVTTREGDWAVARVEDNGAGMAQSVRERLFDPFFTTKPVGEGTGLGLYVSYEIIQSHGGEIRVESEPGAGTIFEVRLPLGPRD